jgi:hypothetical protein
MKFGDYNIHNRTWRRAPSVSCLPFLLTGLREGGPSQADYPRGIGKPVQQDDRLISEGRVHMVRRNLTQGRQDETAIRNAGMGNGQFRVGIDNVVKEQEIQVQGPGPPTLFSNPAKKGFPFLEDAKEVQKFSGCL